MMDVEVPPRALPRTDARAVAGPTLDGSPAAALDLVCHEGNGKDDTTSFAMVWRTPNSTWSLDAAARSPLSPTGACALDGLTLGGLSAAALDGACHNSNGKDEAASFALPTRQVMGYQLGDTHAADGPADDGPPVAVVGGASNEGDDSTKTSLAISARQNAAADVPEVQATPPAPHDDARAVNGPAADDPPAAVFGGTSDEGDGSTKTSLALPARENAAADGANCKKLRSVEPPMQLAHPRPVRLSQRPVG